jgi:hypothetical protein
VLELGTAPPTESRTEGLGSVFELLKSV